MHHGAINRESERLVNNLAELRSELRCCTQHHSIVVYGLWHLWHLRPHHIGTIAASRHEIDKLTASQRLDLNLEKGRMR